jgi:hypothetical protein
MRTSMLRRLLGSSCHFSLAHRRLRTDIKHAKRSTLLIQETYHVIKYSSDVPLRYELKVSLTSERSASCTLSWQPKLILNAFLDRRRKGQDGNDFLSNCEPFQSGLER